MTTNDIKFINFVNLTPHAIVVDVEGETISFPPSGIVARVESSLEEIQAVDAYRLFSRKFGEVIDLPEPEEGIFYIVSALVKGATSRKDVVAPATDHKEAKRNEKGHIISVPGFIL